MDGGISRSASATPTIHRSPSCLSTPSCTSNYLGSGDYLLPANGSANQRLPLFTWNPLSGKQSYFVLVATDPMKPSLRAHDLLSGKQVWVVEDPKLSGLPKIDARGLIYTRRGDGIAALDPKTGATLADIKLPAHTRLETRTFLFGARILQVILRAAIRESGD